MRKFNLSLKIFAACLLFAAIWPLVLPADHEPVRKSVNIDWAQAQWGADSGGMQRLRLSEVEKRFANQFPGSIGHFFDGRREWVVRVVQRPTRMHPAADCFRGLGYCVTTPHVRIEKDGESWRCFTADKPGKHLNVCERIFDQRGGRWTDTSSWYWSVLFKSPGQGHGPWWAITRVEIAR